jgi:fumarylacetoacetase
LLELTWGGQNNINLSNGEVRKFLEDGDSIIMTGWAMKNGKKIGFG